MKKLFAKIAGLFAAIALLIGLASCFGGSYSSSSLKSGLENAGYKVEENPIINLEASKLEGYKSSLVAYKTIDGKEDGILILIFDSTASADKASATNNGVATEFISLMHSWGRKNAPESDTSVYGTANNIVWAGSSAAKKAAGIF